MSEIEENIDVALERLFNAYMGRALIAIARVELADAVTHFSNAALRVQAIEDPNLKLKLGQELQERLGSSDIPEYVSNALSRDVGF